MLYFTCPKRDQRESLRPAPNCYLSVTFLAKPEAADVAKLHLNAKNVENLKPGFKQEDYWDTALPKFGVRVSAQGKKTWTLQI